MTLDNLVNKQGPLAETFPEFDPGTIQEANEITTDRHTDKNLRNKWFWTADGATYTLENRETLYFTEREFNPMMKPENIDEAVKQLRGKNNYQVKDDDLKAIRAEAKNDSGKVLKVILSRLNLIENDDEYCHFEINTSDYGSLNKDQRAVAEKVYGSGKDEKGNDIFEKNMEMLNKAGIKTTNVYVLNPKYVRKNVKKGTGIARACWLGSFVDNSYFIARGRGVGYSGNWLRGVRRVNVAEGDARKSEQDIYQTAYQTLLKNPAEAVKRMTDDLAAGISGILTKYLSAKKQ